MCKWSKFRSTSKNHFFYRSLPFLFAFPVCHAVLVNRTIDSNIGDPVTGFVPIYQPQGPWANQSCSDCWIQPDISKAFDGTWEAATYQPSMQNVNITLHFTGVAIWVFFILANANDHGSIAVTNTQVNITLDGHYAGNFSHDPDMTMHALLYNQTIFSTTGLANTSHELVIATNDYPYSSFINFDWATYTVDVDAPTSQRTSSPTSQNSPSKIGIIVGCTLGGLAVIALVIVFLVRRRRRTPLVRSEMAEGILDIEIPPRKPMNGRFQNYQRASSASEYRSPPVSASSIQPLVQARTLEQSNMVRLREVRQREIDQRIQAAQHEIDNLKSTRNSRFASAIRRPPASAANSVRPMQDLATLRNEVQQLRARIEYLQAQRESAWAMGLSDELPPAYTRY